MILATKPEEIDYKLPDKQLKIIVLGKLSKLRENTGRQFNKITKPVSKMRRSMEKYK